MQKKWVLLDPPLQSFYDEHPNLPPVVLNLLYHRGLRTQAEIDLFLNPEYSKDVHDPFLFKDMKKAALRILSAIESNERIAIHGDYDADGVSGSVILSSLFKALEYENYTVFLPHRETDGYGLNTNTVQLLKDEHTALIITCDCGISNYDAVVKANGLGIDVIITDHHTTPQKLPPAYATIHPKVPGESYPDQTLAGGGVAFKLLQGILNIHAETHDTLPNGERHEAFEKWQLDMVAIASVADMVPLLGESRVLTKYGLLVLNKTRRIGMQKLLLQARLIDEEGGKKYDLTPETIGFQIAPRINAAGRINHANTGYQLLITNDPIEATDLAFQLDQENEERKKLTRDFVKQAIDEIETNQRDASFLFVFHRDWSAGIVGLIASQIKERYQKPTIAMTEHRGEIMGSGRSIEGFNLIEAMQAAPQFFSKFGGHPMACGFTLASFDIKDAMQTALRSAFATEVEHIDLTPTLQIDAELALEAVDWELYNLLGRFEPFGQGNRKPTYLAQGLTVREIKPIGKDKTHLIINVSHTTPRIRKTIGWGLCDENRGDGKNWSKLLQVGDHIDMVFEIGINEWNGNRELQLTIVDLKKL